MNANADQITYWNDVAGAKWVANQKRLDGVFTPLTQALIAAAAPQPNDHVLDIGCGCGETSLLFAAKVGPSGAVLAVDISAPMLAHAATRVADADPGTLATIEWLQADAMMHAFAPSADLMISRFGVMFFADPVAAFKSIRRGLRPGGRFAVLCWRPRSQVEWMQWPLDQVASVLPPPDETTGEPGPFGFADADRTLGILVAAGFRDVTARAVDAPLVMGEGPEAVENAMGLLEDTGPVAALLREAEPNARASAEAMLRKALKAREIDGAIQLKGACWLYTGVV